MTDGVSDAWPNGGQRVSEILDIVAKETSVERSRLTPDTTIASLDIASLDMVQAMFALESHFKVEVPLAMEQDSGEFATVGDLVSHVLAVVDQGAAV